MSQRKAKEYRRAMDQYKGVVEDVDDLKRRIGAMEARHRREDQLAAYKRRKARREYEEIWANLQAEREEREERRRRNERRRRELARRRITVACAAVLLLAIVWAIATACTAQENEPEKEATAVDPVVFVTPTIGEDPMEAEKDRGGPAGPGIPFRRRSPFLRPAGHYENSLRGIRVPLSPGAGRGGGRKPF